MCALRTGRTVSVKSTSTWRGRVRVHADGAALLDYLDHIAPWERTHDCGRYC
jgi:hypothetical protein